MDYKNEIGKRIRRARIERGWKLGELERETGDLLSGKRINSYENGDRMPGPAEAVTLAKALGTRPAYLLAVEDVQLPITLQEEALIRNWRTLNERDRMELYRKVETLAMQNRDPVPDSKVERHLPTPLPSKVVSKKVKR